MTHDLVLRENAEVTFASDQVDLIKRTVAKGCSTEELELFLYQSKRTGLDPLTRQIYAVPRWDSKLGRNVMQIQTAIDGFRLIAQRTGKYAGQVGPFWCGSDGVWKDVWLEKDPPLAAKIGVYHKDFKEALFAVARFESYVQKTKDGFPQGLWGKMPDTMLAKCAEALALRKAFPNDLSGIYTSDEMGQADNHVSEVATEPKQIPQQPVNYDVGMDASENYVMPFGIFKGKKLSEIPEPELQKSLDYWRNRSKTEGKPLTGGPLAFCNAATQYLAKRREAIQPKSEVDDDIPFFDEDIPF